jgi:hypothetical protein
VNRVPVDREFRSSMGPEVHARYLLATASSGVTGDQRCGAARLRGCGHKIAPYFYGLCFLPILGLREVGVAAFGCAMGSASTTADSHNETRTKPLEARARSFSRV